MGGSVSNLAGSLILPLLALSACQSGNEYDLATNSDLYTSPGYQARMAADRVAFMPMVVDRRAESRVEEASSPYPQRWMPDEYWVRPMAVMVDDILRQEFEDSGLFAGLENAPPPTDDAIIVQVELLDARAGIEELFAKRRAVAEFRLRVVVLGPVEGGERSEIWREEFDKNLQTQPVMRTPPLPGFLGSAARRVVSATCAGIDESNVARSGLPTQASPQ